MSRIVAGIVAAALSLTAGAAFAADAPWAGTWTVTASFANGRTAAPLTLTETDGKIEGTAGPLDENQYFPLTLRGKRAGATAQLEVLARGDVVGTLSLTARGAALSGSGTLYGVPVTLVGVRPSTARVAPQDRVFKPVTYQLQYSARAEPVLRIAPGDRVTTTTLDNEGRNAALQYEGMPGNTLTGPFYVEGAMPGDTLVVHIERVVLTRDTARMYSGALNERVVQSGYVQTPAKGWGRTWVLDRDKGVARLEAPGDKLTGLELPLKPMIGSIGVAPPLNQALYAGDLGFHGGNLDYNRLVAGSTLYLPVYHAGALLSLGDGHALQGDGEISGQGLETSLEVTFRVELIKGKSLGQVWSEDADYVMVSGIDNGLDASLAMATTGMARWLKDRYQLNDSEVAALLSAAVEYDIAEVVDTRPHVVAKIAKTTLAMIREP